LRSMAPPDARRMAPPALHGGNDGTDRGAPDGTILQYEPGYERVTVMSRVYASFW